MQAYTQPHRMSGSPRIELIENGTMYSNLDDLDTKITYQKKGNTHQFHIVTHLVDSKQQFSSVGKEVVEIDYIFQEKEIGIHCSIPESLRKAGLLQRIFRSNATYNHTHIQTPLFSFVQNEENNGAVFLHFSKINRNLAKIKLTLYNFDDIIITLNCLFMYNSTVLP